MIFTYWTHDPQSGVPARPPDSVAAWRQLFPQMRVYEREDIAVLLKPFGPEAVDLFNRIRIPACQSDLARLLLLHAIGGLYVDAHTGPGDTSGLIDILDRLSAFELVVFEKPWERKHADDLHLINTAIGARKGSSVAERLVRSALENLRAHEQAEARAPARVPYNIFVLTGAWDIRANILQEADGGVRLKPELQDSVCVYPLPSGPEAGLRLYHYYSYRKPGRHWSERQNSEPLFAPRARGD